jgi:plasmid stabilization system protein ParE
MDANLIFMPEAERDLDEAYAWYEGQQEGRGEDLLSRVNACIQEIRRSPEIRTFCYKHYRRGLVRKFPYAVYYGYSQGTVTIYGVLHTSRDQGKWRGRLS